LTLVNVRIGVRRLTEVHGMTEIENDSGGDAVRDAIALAEAEFRGDKYGAAVITGNCDTATVKAVLLALLAEVRADRAAGGDVSMDNWRPWALSAMGLS
jgi:hypothetical protein